MIVMFLILLLINSGSYTYLKGY